LIAEKALAAGDAVARNPKTVVEWLGEHPNC
jgi:hypothetical protein